MKQEGEERNERVRVRVYVCMCDCMCVCEREREKERERERGKKNLRKSKDKKILNALKSLVFKAYSDSSVLNRKMLIHFRQGKLIFTVAKRASLLLN